MDFLHALVAPLELFARGGGGGSGGGGGGGSGSGGGIIILLGYMPMHFIGAVLRKWANKQEAKLVAFSVVGWAIAAAYGILWIFIWGGIGVWITLGALVGMPAGLYGWFGKLKHSKFMDSRLQAAAANDAAWDEQRLTDHATSVFLRYQQDWSNLDTAAMQAYTTPRYHQHATLLVYILQLMGRKDIMSDVAILDTSITDMSDSADNNHDSFTIGLTARAHDQLIENDGTKLYTDNGTFTEYWTFNRNGNTWLLDKIEQATANQNSMNTELSNLAAANHYYFSPDMGWLFIPKRGQLFGGAKFGTADINNHIVGLYNNQLLVQLYSYVKDPSNVTKPYVIAQVNVPKQYGQIIVRRNKLIQKPIFGLKRVETEWTQFNKEYEVFASAPEQVTSFELLNPTYMEQLAALPFEVNIEVVDNVIYLYTSERGSTVETYQTMLDLVNKAFKELRL